MLHRSRLTIVVGLIGPLTPRPCLAQAAAPLAIQQVDPSSARPVPPAPTQAPAVRFNAAQADAALSIIERVASGEPIVSGVISKTDGTSAMVDPTTNTITIVQGGGGNVARVTQNGDRNDVSVTQDGRGNSSAIDQIGAENSFEHVQLGDGLTMQGEQTGTGAVVSVTQTPY